MGEVTEISWCHHTANFWWGCTKVSQGCKHCYAATFTTVRKKLDVWGPTAGREAKKTVWTDVLAWNRKAGEAGERRRVFVSSLADFFEGPSTCQDADAYKVITDARARAFPLMEQCANLDFLLLTKRPENVRDMVPLEWLAGKDATDYANNGPYKWEYKWPKNVWIGTSVEDQATADQRIPHLLQVNAPVRFLSMEPLLGPVDLSIIRAPQIGQDLMPLYGMWQPNYSGRAGGAVAGGKCNGIDWVIVGGESGTNARPMNPEWVLRLRDQCVRHRVPFHFKQWGEWVRLQDSPGAVGNLNMPTHRFPLENHPELEAYCLARVGKKAAGRLLDGRTWDELPEVTHV